MPAQTVPLVIHSQSHNHASYPPVGLFFGGTSPVILLLVAPVWIVQLLVTYLISFLFFPSARPWVCGPFTIFTEIFENPINFLISERIEQGRSGLPRLVRESAEFNFAENVMHLVRNRVEAAASQALLLDYDNHRRDSPQVRLNMVLDESDLDNSINNHSNRATEVNLEAYDTEESRRSRRQTPTIRESTTERLRGEYARLQHTISQNEDAQTLCTIFTAVVPFIGIFFMKMVFDNFMPIFRVGTALFGFLVIDYRVQALITAVRPTKTERFMSVIAFIALFCLTSGIFLYDDGFSWQKSTTFQYSGDSYHGFFFTLFCLAITDLIIKMGVSGLKLLIIIVPLNLSLSAQRKSCQFLEYISQMFRCMVPIPHWFNYFTGNNPSGISWYYNMALLVLYLILKLRELIVLIRVTAKCALRIIWSSPYGVIPSRGEIEKEGMCSICHGDFSVPTKLSCSHVFCLPCIDTWLDNENTCPMCRAVVEKKDNAWKTGATSKMIRIY